MGDPISDGHSVDVAHSTKLALVDGSGGLRGYYAADDVGVDEVFHRAARLVREPAP